MTRGVHPALFGLLFGVAAALLPSVARADAVAEATDLFARARELRGHGDCAGAIPLFQKAHDIYPAGLGSLRNLAECEESLGHVAAARADWLDLGRALAQHTEPKYAGWDQDAERGVARLTPTQETSPVDGAGPKQAAAPAPAAVSQAVAPATASAAPMQPAPGDSTKRTAAWVGVGVAAAGLVGAGIAALVRKTALDDLTKEGCQNQGGRLSCTAPATSSQNDAANRGREATTLVNVFVAVGAVGLATGLVLFAITPSRSNSSTELVLSPSGVSAVGRF
jgi:hypothetical protein